MGSAAARASRPFGVSGPVQGRGYVSLLRRGAMCIAPLTTEVVIRGNRQPGDVDTTRTYELAAAHCFIHYRRTQYVAQLYGPEAVPMFDDANELAEQILAYLPRSADRAKMAIMAHARAVPHYANQREGRILLNF